MTAAVPAAPEPRAAEATSPESAAAPESTKIPRDAYVFAASLFMLVAATNILTPLIPQVRLDFGVSISTAGLIVGSYGLARLAVDLPAGWLSRSFGERRLSIVALFILVGASIVGFFSPTVPVLIAARIGSGIAVGILATVILSGLGASAKAENRGKVMSLFHVANNIGIASYPMFGGLIALAFGWRATFAVTAILAIIASLLLIPLLLRIDFRAAEGKGGKKIDDSRVLYGRARVIAMVATNFGVMANMIHRHGFRNTVLPLYAATVLMLDGLNIATAIAFMSITGLMVATPGGALGDRVGRRRVITAGLATVAVGDLLFLLTGDLISFLIAAALIGFGDFFTSSQTALLSEVVPAKERTFALSTYRFSADLGALIGPILLAFVMDITNAQTAIILAACILFTASLSAWLLVPKPKPLVGDGDRIPA